MNRRMLVRVHDTPVLSAVLVDGQPLTGVLSVTVEANPREGDSVVVLRIASAFVDIEHQHDTRQHYEYVPDAPGVLDK